jgi:hypothetical protein
MLLAPQDEQSLQRFLGCQEVPPAVAAEYAIRKRMFDMDGSAGPLGTVGLIDLVRSLGLGPKAPEPIPTDVNWRDYPQDGSVRVMAGPFFGDMQAGTFLGFVQNGTLAIKTDFDQVVHECRRDMVRLSTTPVPISDNLSLNQPDARAAILDAPAQTQPEAQGGEEAPSVPQSAPVVVQGANERPTWQADPSFDWESVAPGEAVWVSHQNDVIDAKFTRLGLPGEVIVTLEDETTLTVPANSVTPAGAGVA